MMPEFSFWRELSL